ncbi:hypothetical protein [Ottowia beijingensis]
MDWMLRQLAQTGGATTAQEARRAAFNPKPPGSVQVGSATHHVLRKMATAPAEWWAYRQLAVGVPTRSSFHWALTLLLARGHIEASRSDPRNTRNMRYRLTPEGQKAARKRP